MVNKIAAGIAGLRLWMVMLTVTLLFVIVAPILIVMVITHYGVDLQANVLHLGKNASTQYQITVEVCRSSWVGGYATCIGGEPLPGVSVTIPTRSGQITQVTNETGRIDVGEVIVPRMFMPVAHLAEDCDYDQSVWHKGNQLIVTVVTDGVCE